LNSTASNILHVIVGKTKNIHYSIDDPERKFNVLFFLVKTVLTYFSVKIMFVDSKEEERLQREKDIKN